MKTLSLLFFLSLPVFAESRIPVEVKPVYHEFIKESKYYGIKPNLSNLKIIFGHPERIESHMVGYCDPSHKVIYLNKKFWVNSSKIRREILLFHEIGHCSYDQEHDMSLTKLKEPENLFPISIPKSLMIANSISPDVFKFYKGYYLNEFFNRLKTNPGKKLDAPTKEELELVRE